MGMGGSLRLQSKGNGMTNDEKIHVQNISIGLRLMSFANTTGHPVDKSRACLFIDETLGELTDAEKYLIEATLRRRKEQS